MSRDTNLGPGAFHAISYFREIHIIESFSGETRAQFRAHLIEDLTLEALLHRVRHLHATYAISSSTQSTVWIRSRASSLFEAGARLGLNVALHRFSFVRRDLRFGASEKIREIILALIILPVRRTAKDQQ